jgi:hypothetical protein
MSLVQDIKNILADLGPAQLQELKAIATHVVSDGEEWVSDAQKILAIVPANVLHVPSEVPDFLSELAAILPAIAEALAAL